MPNNGMYPVGICACIIKLKEIMSTKFSQWLVVLNGTRGKQTQTLESYATWWVHECSLLYSLYNLSYG